MRVVIVDDDPFVCTSLQTILGAQADVEVAGVGHDGAAAVALYAQHGPDVLLMDIQMPGMGGLEAGQSILAADPSARIVYLTTFADDEYIAAALRMGAKGYLIKQEVATIAPALRLVMAGQSVLGSEVLERMDSLVRGPASVGDSPALAELSEREREIVALVAEGLDNRDIAAQLYMSEGTVRNHISAILAKLDLKNRTQLAVLYLRGH
ncbi:MAG: response regulator transcription factor [Bifidobacteriaceae bacterium]|jgi:DNA-binding NarL/FixJ family response regulator|nr:response regulator transcription factor [Bifidobacteriaceae bacterium]